MNLRPSGYEPDELTSLLHPAPLVGIVAPSRGERKAGPELGGRRAGLLPCGLQVGGELEGFFEGGVLQEEAAELHEGGHPVDGEGAAE